jgi:two-component system, NtrC family, response regulator AtoC
LRGKILIIDDEELIRSSIKQHLEKDGHDVSTAKSGEEGVSICRIDLPDIVLLDLHMAGISGIETLKLIKELNKEVVVIIISAHGDIETAVSAIKLGAYEFVEKPFDLSVISILVKNALDTLSLKKEVTFLREEQHDKYNLKNVVGESPVIKNVLAIAEKIAESDANTVLIQGESGTGKTLIARVIHYRSARADKPFVEVTCTALPETLVESELFGYEKGAFTDAKSSKKGLFEIADGGTIYLDEIGDMKLSTQSKFLKVIEEKTFKRIGGLKDTKVDVRIIATTNRDIKEEVKNGNFREDLYYRLNVIPIRIPPLRERPEDIIPIAMHFLDNLRKETRKDIIGISKDAKELILEYGWPGNIRELKNMIERIFILEKEGLILPEHLPIEVKKDRDKRYNAKESDDFQFSLPKDGVSIEDVEKNFIIQALKNTGNNQTKAAKLLNLSRDALRYRMQKFGLIVN